MEQRDTKILRLATIDRAFRTKHAKSQKMIAQYVREKLGIDYSEGTVKLDLKRMREIYEAPIQYDTIEKEYRYSKEYEFSEAFLKYWSDFMILSNKLSKVI